MNPFDQIPEGPKASVHILAVIVTIALAILLVVGVSVLLAPPGAKL